MGEITLTERESLETILRQFEDIKQKSATNLEYLFNIRLHLLQRYQSPAPFENDSLQRGIYILHQEKARTFLFVSGNYAGIERNNEPTYSIEKDQEHCNFYRSALRIGEVYCPRQSSQEFVVVANELESIFNSGQQNHYLFLALERGELGGKR